MFSCVDYMEKDSGAVGYLTEKGVNLVKTLTCRDFLKVHGFNYFSRGIMIIYINKILALIIYSTRIFIYIKLRYFIVLFCVEVASPVKMFTVLAFRLNKFCKIKPLSTNFATYFFKIIFFINFIF